MKILMTAMALDIGGAETHITELCRALAARGHDVTVASAGGVYVKALEAAGVKHVTLPLASKKPQSFLASYMGLKKLIKQEKFDVVHAHARIPAFVCSLVRRRMFFPLVTTAHGTFKVSPLWRTLSSWGDMSLAVSFDIKDYLIDNYGVPPDNITLTVNGIDTCRFRADADCSDMARELGLSPSEHRILYVSRLDPSCSAAGHDLLSCAPALMREYPDVEIVLVGGGSDENAMREKADKLNRDAGRKYVHMTGARTDIEAFCAWANLTVGVSRSVLEAMSAETPAVLAGAQGYLGVFGKENLKEALDTNFTCRTRPCADASAVMRDIKAIFSMSDTDRASLGRFARETVEKHYSLERMALDAEQVYGKVIYPRSGGNIVLSGYYGFSNIGDDSLLQAIIDELHGACPDKSITVLSHSPRGTARRFLTESKNRFNAFSVLRSIRNAEMLVFGGGSLLQSVTSRRTLPYYLFLINYAKRHGKKVVLYANGLGPFRNSDDKIKAYDALADMPLITLRDSRSYRNLTDYTKSRDNIHITADPAVTLPYSCCAWASHVLSSRAGVDAAHDYFILSVRSCSWKTIDSGTVRKLSEYCKRVKKELGITPVVVSMQEKKDTEICREIADKAGAALLERLSPCDLKAIIRGARFVTAMRLHVLIYAAASAVPSVGLSYDAKVDAFFEDTHNPDMLSAYGFKEDTLWSCTMHALGRDKEELERTARDITERALTNIERIKELF